MKGKTQGPRPLAPGSDSRMLFDAAIGLYMQRLNSGTKELTAKRHVASAMARALLHYIEQAGLPANQAMRFAFAPVGALLSRLGADESLDDSQRRECMQIAGQIARLIKVLEERNGTVGGTEEEA